MELSLPKPAVSTISETSLFIAHVYQWMTLALLTTAATAFVVASNVNLQNIFLGNQLYFFGLIIAELALVFGLSLFIQKMSLATAIASFTVYSILNGITLSVILLAYTGESVAGAFAVTAGTFAVMSFYGLTTKRDLTTVGNLAFMALIGLILASIVNLFLGNSTLNLIISYAGVLIFVALTAYDNQKLKTLSGAGSGSSMVILGALTLYLDFINLFLFILRIMGGRRR